ncbi:NADPH:quinone oxidoreductase family protein [Streptomyces sp. NPDC055722]
MKAVQVVKADDGLRLEQVSLAQPTVPGVVIAVEAAGVAQPDVLQISGAYQVKREIPFVPGTEAVGVVVSAPPGAEHLVGRRVIAITPQGSWQEQVSVPPQATFVVPDGLSPTQATLLLVNHVAAYFALATRGRARRGETLLVHGAAGGIGGAAVQIGNALGLRTIAVASTPEKAAYARSLGATDVVASDGWKESVEALAGPAGVDLVFDPVAGDRFEDGLRVLKPGGRFLIIGFLGGPIPEVKVNKLLLRNISLVGVAAGAYMQYDPGEMSRTWAAITALIDRGALPLAEATTFPLADASVAVSLVRDRQAVGKVCLVPIGNGGARGLKARQPEQTEDRQ